MALTLAEAQARLSDLIHGLSPGEQVAIVENARTVATLTAASPERLRPIPGRGKGTLTILSDRDDFLEDFRDYLL